MDSGFLYFYTDNNARMDPAQKLEPASWKRARALNVASEMRMAAELHQGEGETIIVVCVTTIFSGSEDHVPQYQAAFQF